MTYTAEQIAEIINTATCVSGLAAKAWEKNGKSRVYITLTSVRDKQVGYIDLSDGKIDLKNCYSDGPRYVFRAAGIEYVG